MTGRFPVESFQQIDTPFYYYDLDLLRHTLGIIADYAPEPNFHVHYALKACAVPEVLREIVSAGLGADCVSGGEIRAALEAGVPAGRIVFAGVAKADWEIALALDSDILCFNVESVEELEVISNMAAGRGKTARVCLRVNPDIDAHTHQNITTGLADNKFGIQMSDLQRAIEVCCLLPNIEFLGLHFHIGSQITDMQPFRNLCMRINTLVEQTEQSGVIVRHINVGGGLGINYEHPNHIPVADFEAYFNVFRRMLNLRPEQTLHFELGRSVVAPCGSLITRVLYVKQGKEKQFAIVDAGMTDLIRPALYNAFHRIENISNNGPVDETYDVVGPICESSDVFVRNFSMAVAHRGDLLAIRSAGAYGEIMASQYNLRRLPGHITSDNIGKLKKK
ncbi:MAG: diaminopimelate decarboxylase [Paludibacteraceae bacterium]|nr:diaminopimelate decarboxylase [Paludibacteraceae bacterium]